MIYDNNSWRDFYTFVVEGSVEHFAEDKGRKALDKVKSSIEAKKRLYCRRK